MNPETGKAFGRRFTGHAVLILLLTLGIFASTIIAGEIMQEPGRERLALGLALMRQEKYRDAIKVFEELIEKNPNDKDAWVQLAKAFSRTDDLEAGERFFAMRVRQDSTNAYGWYGLGMILRKKNQWPKALKQFNRALTIKTDFVEAWAMKTTLLRYLGRYKEALQAGENGLKLAQDARDAKGQAMMLNGIGAVYYFLGKMTPALSFFEQSLKQAQAAKDTILQAGLLNNLGTLYRSINDIPKATKYLRASMQLAGREDAVTLGNIGDCFLQISASDSAIFYYERALSLLPVGNDPKLRGVLLGALGAAYSLQARNDLAIRYLEDGIELHRQIGFLSGMSTNLINLGAIYVETDDLSGGLEYFFQARDIADSLGEKYDLQIATGNIGEIYRMLGDYGRAIDYLNEASALADTVQDSSSRGAWLGAKASCYLALQDTAKALSTFRDALRIHNEIGDKRNAAFSYSNVAAIQARQGKPDAARENFDRALSLFKEVKNLLGEGILYNQLAEMQLQQGKLQEADDSFHKALDLGAQMKSDLIIWRAQYGLGQVQEQRGRLAQAKVYYRDAITQIERNRSKLPEDLQRIGYLQNKVAVYEKMVGVLQRQAEQKNTPALVQEAFAFSERARARALLDLLVQARIDLEKGVEPKLLNEANRLRDEITQLQIRMYKEMTTSKAYSKMQQIRHDLENELEQVHFRIAAQQTKSVKLAEPQPVSVAEIQQHILQANEVMLEYFLGESGSLLWYISRQKIRSVPLPARARLDSLTLSYFREISRPPLYGAQNRQAGRQLYKILLEPVAADLENVEHLIIIPDAALHVLPFETLITGGTSKDAGYAVEKWRFSYAPSASVLYRLIRQRARPEVKPQKDLLVFADPHYGKTWLTDKRGQSLLPLKAGNVAQMNAYQQRGFSLTDLHWAGVESQAITELFPKGKVVVYTREQASEDRLKQENLRNYRIIHFSTHGLLDEAFPLRSCLVLTLDDDPTEDGFVQLREIMDLQLDADLTVLSACQTGRGRFSNGEGVVGLPRAFLYAGARSIVDSLWKVDDRSTAELMGSFYKYISQGKAVAEALQQAKLELLNGESKRWRHPYFWAPFVLHGRYHIRPGK